MRPAQLLSSALLFSTLSAAWSFQEFEAVQQFGSLLRRADESSTAASSKDSASSKASAAASSSQPTDSSAASSAAESSAAATSFAEITLGAASTSEQTASSGASATSTGTGKTSGSTDKSSGTATTSKKHSTTAIDPRLPAGGISMITPSALAASQYYKIGNYITFAWNYTSLSVTPSAVDILASCSENQATYTIALNQSVNPTQAVTWDTGAYQSTATIPLLTETYTLIIHDAAKDVSATAQAGYLATYKQFTFGMYVPQPYTPMAEYVCATCSGAMSAMERQTLGFMLGMVAITITTFTIFAGGWGIF